MNAATNSAVSLHSQACTSCINRWKESFGDIIHSIPVFSQNICDDVNIDDNGADQPVDPASPAAKKPRNAITTDIPKGICPLCLGLLQLNRTTDDSSRSVVSEWCLDVRSPRLTREYFNRATTHRNEHHQPKTTLNFQSLQQSIDAMQQEWEFDCIALEITLPAVFVLRERAVYWQVRHLQPSNPDNITIRTDIREAIRSHFTRKLKGILGINKPLKHTAAMRLCISCRIEAAIENEAAWLNPPPPKVGRKKRFQNKRDNIINNGTTNSNNNTSGPSPSAVASQSVVSKLATMSAIDFHAKCTKATIDLTSPTTSPIVVLTPHRESQFIGGRYVKLVRGLPQTPWVGKDGIRVGDSSVEEELAKYVLPGLRADDYVFLSSGREDIDVRMMGNGRPFAFEVKNARKVVATAVTDNNHSDAMLHDSNNSRNNENSDGCVGVLDTSKVQIRGLRPLLVHEVKLLKQEDEEEKRKAYVALCWIPRAVTAADISKLNLQGSSDTDLNQWTPLRVLHRRSNLCRKRTVHSMKAHPLPDKPEGYFALELTTAAGTYVKEFVHGDRGRTQPCIKDMLGVDRAECVYLDVTGVELEGFN